MFIVQSLRLHTATALCLHFVEECVCVCVFIWVLYGLFGAQKLPHSSLFNVHVAVDLNGNVVHHFELMHTV